MKLKSTVAVITLVTALPAYSGDWSGFSLGVAGGQSSGNLSILEVFTDLGDTTEFDNNAVALQGMVGGLTAGASMDTGQYVLGVEGDFLFTSNVNGFQEITAAPGELDYLNEVTVNGKNSFSIRARGGVKAGDNALIYVSGGYEWNTVEAEWYGVDQDATDTFTNTYQGMTFGGGFETMTAGGWVFGVEYRQTSFDSLMNTSENNTIDGAPVDVESEMQTHTVLATIKKFF